MKCIKCENVYYYDEELDDFFFKEPYNFNTYTFLIKDYCVYNKSISVYILNDISEVEHRLLFHPCSCYLLNKKTFNLIKII